MPNWTHNICAECWNKKNPGHLVVRAAEHLEDTCCYCGERNGEGIYVRDDPKNTPFCNMKD
jgi:hypothetical protein